MTLSIYYLLSATAKPTSPAKSIVPALMSVSIAIVSIGTYHNRRTNNDSWHNDHLGLHRVGLSVRRITIVISIPVGITLVIAIWIAIVIAIRIALVVAIIIPIWVVLVVAIAVTVRILWPTAISTGVALTVAGAILRETHRS